MAKPVRSRIRSNRAQGNISTSHEVKDSNGNVTKSKPEVLKPVDVFTSSDTPAYVKVSGGITKNMDNFNFIRVDVSVTLPCDPTQDAVDDTKKKCAELVDGYLDEEYRKAVTGD